MVAKPLYARILGDKLKSTTGGRTSVLELLKPEDVSIKEPVLTNLHFE